MHRILYCIGFPWLGYEEALISQRRPFKPNDSQLVASGREINSNNKALPQRTGALMLFCCVRCLHAERRAAAASALDVRVIEFEAGTFEGLDIVDDDTF